MTYIDDRKQLLAGKKSCVQLTQEFLSISKQNRNNAFIEVFEGESLSRAQEIDKKITAGTAGKLAGMVVSIKDLISIENHSVTGASKILQGYTSNYNSTAVERLLAEDAILIGRTNCDEFGMGSSNENSFFGVVTNAFDQTKVAGGSSGGAAVSVQEGSCHIALGTDTGGSVRQPASFCGVFGLKPTYSRISRYGLLAYASSFDTIGIIGNSPSDLQLVLDVIEGKDEKDSTSSRKTEKTVEVKKLAYFKQVINSRGMQEEVLSGFLQTIASLRDRGYTIDEIDFPETEHLLETYYILTTAEASSNLSRYDGLRYGYGDAIEAAESLDEAYKNTRSEGFGSEVKRRILLGTFVLSASYYDAYYTKAQKARQLIRDKTLSVFTKYDLIISPVAPTSAFKIGTHSKDPLEMYLSDLYTVHASVCGLPALSIPNGVDKEEMPFGIQITANDFEEEKLLLFANILRN